jgi:hypothetical protein
MSLQFPTMDANLQNAVEFNGSKNPVIESNENGGLSWLEILVLHAVDAEEKV